MQAGDRLDLLRGFVVDLKDGLGAKHETAVVAKMKSLKVDLVGVPLQVEQR